MKIRGLFYFFLENPSKKNYTDGIFKKRLLRKNGPFSGSWRKKFFLWRRARSRGVGVRGVLARRGVGVRWTACEAFRAASVCVWMDVPGRVWMDAMEVVHV